MATRQRKYVEIVGDKHLMQSVVFIPTGDIVGKFMLISKASTSVNSDFVKNIEKAYDNLFKTVIEQQG